MGMREETEGKQRLSFSREEIVKREGGIKIEEAKLKGGRRALNCIHIEISQWCTHKTRPS